MNHFLTSISINETECNMKLNTIKRYVIYVSDKSFLKQLLIPALTTNWLVKAFYTQKTKLWKINHRNYVLYELFMMKYLSDTFLQRRSISFLKKTFAISNSLYGGHHFCCYIMKSIPSKVKLHAEQDGS